MPVQRMQRGRRISKRRVILATMAVLAVLAAVYYGALLLESSRRRPEPTGDFTSRHQFDVTVEHDGHTYRQKSNLTTILLMGIDNRADSKAISRYRSGGQADFLRLVVVDRGSRQVQQLAIDRDTMTPITILGVLGNKSGTRTQQICLSHSFGNGREQSCDFTREAVSNLLFGNRIDYYVAVNMDAIPQLNDALGGVTVIIEDDFHNDQLPLGATVTLHGEQAEMFVRGRMSVGEEGEGTNANRMRRQQQYIAEATRLFVEKLQQDDEFVGALFDQLTPNMVSNISRSRLVLEAYGAKDYERPAVMELAGEHQIGSDGFAEFLADEEQLEEMVLQLFYDELS